MTIAFAMRPGARNVEVSVLKMSSDLAAAGTVGYPVIGRSGLGNALLPWARCTVWCHDTGVPMLRPQFRQVHIEPGERRRIDRVEGAFTCLNAPAPIAESLQTQVQSTPLPVVVPQCRMITGASGIRSARLL